MNVISNKLNVTEQEFLNMKRNFSLIAPPN